MAQKLPLDFSDFKDMRLEKYLYVDKTRYIYQMLSGGRNYFLSRPRRFGKSLLVSTLECLLKGEKELFEGLWISSSDYHWKEYGVIKLDFSSIENNSPVQFKKSLGHLFLETASFYQLDVQLDLEKVDISFRLLIKALHTKFGQVALLIDEYDSPILRSLHDEKKAIEMREALRDFFMGVKSLNNEIKFTFITGVSSFAKAGVFSGLNNLQILTLRDEYGAVCGYTDEEVDHYFGEHIQEWSTDKNIPYKEIRIKIKEWYNGYQFGEHVSSVYNPFSLMHALNIKKLDNFWFESGNPAFLVAELRKRYEKNESQFMELEKISITKAELGVFDVGAIPTTSLLFQTGYLTLTSFDEEEGLFNLDYPNYEVRTSLQVYLLNIFAHLSTEKAGTLTGFLRGALGRAEIEKMVDLLRQLFAQVPYQLHDPKEKFYHALLQMAFGAAGFKAQSEYATNQGRIDLVLEVAKFIYIIEVKFDENPETALAQVKERKYYERFLSSQKQIILLGLSFNKKPQSFEILHISEKVLPTP